MASSAPHAVAPGVPELLRDADRPGGWLLLVDRIRQSYVDVEDPMYLDFEYMQAFADVLAALPDGPLAVTHVGGGACAFARYISAVRPGSTHIVLEPDSATTDLVRARIPFARSDRIRVRAVDGRDGMTAVRDVSADLVVLDAFAGGRVPAELGTIEFLLDVRRVLRADGIALINIADGPPLTYTRRLSATLRQVFREHLVLADPGVLKGRRYGNIVLAAGDGVLPAQAIRAAAARAMFPRAVRTGMPGGVPLRDTDAMRSPAPPEVAWRVAFDDELGIDDSDDSDAVQ